MASQSTHSLSSFWLWTVLLGAITLIAGVVALANPFAATMAAERLAAWTFMIFGVVQVAQAFRTTSWAGFLWALLFGLVTLALGLSLYANPLGGFVSLTLLVGVLFLVLGMVKLMYSYSLRPLPGWLWTLISAAVSLALGGMILANYPWSAVRVLGVLLAVELISTGCLLLFVGLIVRRQ